MITASSVAVDSPVALTVATEVPAEPTGAAEVYIQNIAELDHVTS